MIKNNINQVRTQSIAPGILPGVNPQDLKGAYCKHCHSTRFIPVCELKMASRFQTAVGQPMLVSFQGGYACVSCGKVNEFQIEGEDKVNENNQENVIN